MKVTNPIEVLDLWVGSRDALAPTEEVLAALEGVRTDRPLGEEAQDAFAEVAGTVAVDGYTGPFNWGQAAVFVLVRLVRLAEQRGSLPQHVSFAEVVA